jgi:FtsZ-interacting cell division protein ZipA
VADKKVIDIAGPNDAKVDIGSKPMIVGHKTLASDPMVRESAEIAENLPDENELRQKVTKTVVEPTNIEKSLPQQDTPEVSKDQPALDKPNPDEIKIEAKEPEQKKSEPVVLTKDEVAKKENDESIQAMEREEKLQKIIQSKQYRVSIKQARGSTKALFVVLVLAVLGGFIAGYLLVDAGKLNLGFDVPYSVLDNKKI